MSTVTVTDTHLHVRFTLAERVGGLVRDLVVPVSAVRSVEVVGAPLAAVHGLRAPGLALPGLRKVGTWRRRGSRDLVCVRRGEPALRIALEGQRHDALLIGTPDAAAVADQVRSAID